MDRLLLADENEARGRGFVYPGNSSQDERTEPCVCRCLCERPFVSMLSQILKVDCKEYVLRCVAWLRLRTMFRYHSYISQGLFLYAVEGGGDVQVFSSTKALSSEIASQPYHHRRPYLTPPNSNMRSNLHSPPLS